MAKRQISEIKKSMLAHDSLVWPLKKDNGSFYPDPEYVIWDALITQRMNDKARQQDEWEQSHSRWFPRPFGICTAVNPDGTVQVEIGG